MLGIQTPLLICREGPDLCHGGFGRPKNYVHHSYEARALAMGFTEDEGRRDQRWQDRARSAHHGLAVVCLTSCPAGVPWGSALRTSSWA